MPTFTLTVAEGASIEVTCQQVVDVDAGGTRTDLVRLYLRTVRLRTSFLNTYNYKLAVVQPGATTGFTSGITLSPLIANAGQVSSFVPDGVGANYNGKDGLYTFNNHATTLLATVVLQTSNVVLNYKFKLQDDRTASFVDTQYTAPGSTQYTFEISSGVNATYNVLAIADGDASSPPKLSSGRTKLFFRYDYNTNPVPASLLTDGVSSVTIAGDDYVAYREPTSLNSYVTVGNDFVLFVPQDNNGDTYASPGTVEDLDSQTFISPLTDLNALATSIFTSPIESAGAGLGTTNVNKTLERGEDIDFYYFTTWTNVTVVDIVDPALVSNVVSSGGTYYNAFSYQGTTYTLSIITTTGGHKNIRMRAHTTFGATVTVQINQINIMPTAPTTPNAVFAL